MLSRRNDEAGEIVIIVLTVHILSIALIKLISLENRSKYLSNIWHLKKDTFHTLRKVIVWNKWNQEFHQLYKTHNLFVHYELNRNLNNNAIKYPSICIKFCALTIKTARNKILNQYRESLNSFTVSYWMMSNRYRMNDRYIANIFPHSHFIVL